jgi:hypothetical protein
MARILLIRDDLNWRWRLLPGHRQLKRERIEGIAEEGAFFRGAKIKKAIDRVVPIPPSSRIWARLWKTSVSDTVRMGLGSTAIASAIIFTPASPSSSCERIDGTEDL